MVAEKMTKKLDSYTEVVRLVVNEFQISVAQVLLLRSLSKLTVIINSDHDRRFAPGYRIKIRTELWAKIVDPGNAFHTSFPPWKRECFQ